MSNRKVIKPSDFPNPELVAVPTFDALFKQKLTIFQTYAPEYAYFLAADPVVKALRAITLAELFLYALANDRALATTLTHALGNDLNAVGLFYGLTRLVIQAEDLNATPALALIEEDDERYRSRIADGVVAFSAGGTREHYRFHAMSADARVKDIVVYSPDLPNFLNMGGRVAITVLSTVNNGVPDLDLLSVVRAAVNAKDVKVVSDILEIEPAAIRPIDLVADIVLERTASPDILLQLEAKLRADFAVKQTLGWDAPRSWFIRTLSPEGVYETTLTSPVTGTVIRPNQFPSLNSVTLRFAGLAAEEDWNVDELAAARLLREVYEKYIAYAVAVKRTRVQIQDDLLPEMRTGIIQPTLVGVADFLGITEIRENGALRPADEMAIALHFHLSKYYERGYYSTL